MIDDRWDDPERPAGGELGVLVSGVGHLGAQRARALAAGLVPGLRLVAVTDRDADRAEEVAARLGVVAVPDLTVGLDSLGVDVVMVASPTGGHAEAVRRSLRSGRHVLCEAPLSVRPEDARALSTRADESRLKLATGLPRRFDPPVRDALAIVAGRGIGRVDSVRVDVGHRASIGFLQTWHTEVRRAGGGVLMHHGPLACDLIRLLLGEVVLAKGFVRQDVKLPVGCETEAFGLFRNHDNAFAELHASWSNPDRGLRLEIRGGEGHLRLGLDPWRLSGRLNDGRAIRRRYLAHRALDRAHALRHGVGRSIVAELRAFAASASGSGRPEATGWDGCRVTEMIQGVYQSDRTGDEVHLKPLLVHLPAASRRRSIRDRPF